MFVFGPAKLVVPPTNKAGVLSVLGKDLPQFANFVPHILIVAQPARATPINVLLINPHLII